MSTSDVVSVLTHEMATPLTVVKGQCERLRGLVADVPGARQVVDMIDRNANRMEHLVVSLSDAQQLDAGMLAVHPAPLDLVELTRAVVETTADTLPGRTIEIAAPAELWVEADGSRIEQIVVNLLTNAAKFSPPGTTIDVTVAATEAEATVVVADQGPGIPPERVGDVFRKFARLERSKKGVGLGLFLSRSLARSHGGDLHYRLRLPTGSEFVLRLPLGPD